METTQEVSACLKKVKKNDQEAARQLVEHLTPMVTKIVKSRRPWRSAEEDLTQEVYKKVFLKLDQYAGQVPFHHWVSRIAVSTCIDHLRAQRRRPEYRFADLTETEADQLQNNLIDNRDESSSNTYADRDLVHNLISKLNADDQRVIKLVHFEQKATAQISALTGWNFSTVKVRSFRARNKLKKLLAEHNNS